MNRRKRRRRKSRGIMKWFGKLKWPVKVLLVFGITMVCLMSALVLYVASLFGKIENPEIHPGQISINVRPEHIGDGYTNFVLFGGDSRSGDVTKNLNTDTIIIVSLNNKTKEVRMVSVYRDNLLDVNGTLRKCNSAYRLGGPVMAMSMLNVNLDLDITKYVTVDFTAVVDLVDMVGGIEVDVSEKERKEVNKYISETGRVAGKLAIPLTKSGVQLLDGVQATTYARIRKNVGDDYARTERQRLVIQKVVEKVMKSDLATINEIVNKLFPRIATNFSLMEVLSYAKDFTKYKITKTTGFPHQKKSGTIPGKGSSVYAVTLKSNVTILHNFLFDVAEYQPSDKVVQISDTLEALILESTRPSVPDNPEPDNPEPDNPNPDNPNPDDPNPDNPNPDNPNPDNPEPDNPNPDNPEPDNPNPDNPNPDDPNPDNPEPDDPNPDNPNPDDPDPTEPDQEDPNPDDPDPTEPDQEDPNQDPTEPNPDEQNPTDPNPEVPSGDDLNPDDGDETIEE